MKLPFAAVVLLTLISMAPAQATVNYEGPYKNVLADSLVQLHVLRIHQSEIEGLLKLNPVAACARIGKYHADFRTLRTFGVAQSLWNLGGREFLNDVHLELARTAMSAAFDACQRSDMKQVLTDFTESMTYLEEVPF